MIEVPSKYIIELDSSSYDGITAIEALKVIEGIFKLSEAEGVSVKPFDDDKAATDGELIKSLTARNESLCDYVRKLMEQAILLKKEK